MTLNPAIATAIASYSNERVGQPVLTPDEVTDLATESTQFTKFIDFIQLCILYAGIFAETPEVNVLAGIAFCVFCGEQVQHCTCIDEL